MEGRGGGLKEEIWEEIWGGGRGQGESGNGGRVECGDGAWGIISGEEQRRSSELQHLPQLFSN